MMLPDYKDIRDRIPEPPLWFDGGGVPRYEPFTRMMLGVYDQYAIYARIACQACGEEFHVGCGYERVAYPLGEPYLTNIEKVAKGFHYGDPPRHIHGRSGGGCVGDTMNCEDLEILEVWDEDTRLHHLEGKIDRE